MSTLQFAELTGTAHKNVLTKARKLLNDLEIEAAQFSAAYKSPTGTQTMLELNKDLSLTLAGQYEPKIAYHVAQSFNAAPQPAALTPLELARENVKLYEALEVAEKARIDAENKAIAKLELIGDHLAGSTIGELGNNIMFNQAAKLLSTNLDIDLGHNTLMRLCRDNGWLMTGERSSSERNYPTQCKIKYFKLKIFHNMTTNIATITPVLTVAGLVAITKLVPHWYAIDKINT